jgi:hypothetical protein
MGAKQRIVNDYIGDLKGDYCKDGSFHYNFKKEFNQKHHNKNKPNFQSFENKTFKNLRVK